MKTDDPSRNYFLRIPEGSIHGPVEAARLRQWVAEGRVDLKCEIREEGATDWQRSDQWFPILRLPPSVAGGSPFPADGRVAKQEQLARAPHRGAIVVLLGALGMLALCPIFCAMAWFMAAADLAEMRAGRMDPSGYSLTSLGYYLGMTGGLLWLVGILVMFGFGILVLLG